MTKVSPSPGACTRQDHIVTQRFITKNNDENYIPHFIEIRAPFCKDLSPAPLLAAVDLPRGKSVAGNAITSQFHCMSVVNTHSKRWRNKYPTSSSLSQLGVPRQSKVCRVLSKKEKLLTDSRGGDFFHLEFGVITHHRHLLFFRVARGQPSPSWTTRSHGVNSSLGRRHNHGVFQPRNSSNDRWTTVVFLMREMPGSKGGLQTNASGTGKRT